MKRLSYTKLLVMSKLLLFFILFRLYGLMSCLGDNMLGPGIWSLIGLEDCENESELPDLKTKIKLEKHRYNRTHDSIKANITAMEDITEQFGILILICKHVDGGCKDYQTISSDSLAQLLRDNSNDSLVRALQLADKDPPDFPLQKGYYYVENFVMDYCDLPPQAVYGKFEALLYLIYETLRVGCVKCVVEFNKFEDDDNICDNS